MNTSSTPASRRALWSWALYDWANSAFPTIIQTFIFATYFTRHIAPDELTASTLWGIANGVIGIGLALGAPIFGAAADISHRRKGWIAFFTLLCVAASCALWWAKPGESYIWFALSMLVLGSWGAEFSFLFYNALLPDLAPADKIGRWSGWGWALGYAGGLLSLVCALFLFIDPIGAPLIANNGMGEAARATFPLAGIWYLVFSLPLFLFLPKEPKRTEPITRLMGQGVRQVVQTIRHLKGYAHIVRFLIARMLYVDGLATLFVFGGVFAAGTFGFTEKEVLLFGIALNVSAGLGALVFAKLDDMFGGRTMIMASLIGLLCSCTLAIAAPTRLWFWLGGMTIGIFVGPVQASSRSYLARVAPEHLRAEIFGFFVMSGKATAFLGPLLVSYVTFWAQSQRLGIASLLLFVLAGALIMLTVPHERDVV